MSAGQSAGLSTDGVYYITMSLLTVTQTSVKSAVCRAVCQAAAGRRLPAAASPGRIRPAGRDFISGNKAAARTFRAAADCCWL